MKLFTKKTLAILLSALIVMGTVSVLSFADPTGNLTTETVFYGGADQNFTAPVVFAKKNDIVKAVVKLTTDFPAGSIALLFQFNSNMFELDKTTHGASSKEHALISDDPDIVGSFFETGTGGFSLSGAGITLAPGKDALFVSTSDSYRVQRYGGTSEFTFYFKVKDSVNLEEIGTMESDPSFTMDATHTTRPNNVAYCDEEVLGNLAPIPVANRITAREYTLNVNSTSNQVVVAGKANFDPNGGTIEGSTAVKTINDGFFGDSIPQTSMPNVVAPEGNTFKDSEDHILF